jgi:hypothetical protein
MQTEIPLKPNPRFDHAYAIVRVDTDAADDVPFNVKITVKKIVADADVAEAEVKRLNELNPGKGCTYFYQVTRLEKGIAKVVSAGGSEGARVQGGVP